MKKSLLIVDDEKDMLQLLKRSLEPELSCRVETAVSGEMALKALERIPFDHDALVLRLEKALERSTLLKENLRLQQECHPGHVFQNLVGQSSQMQRVYESVEMVAKTDLTVLVTGESGTGKELVARAIHSISQRSQAPFVAVNCPAVPENILESELFGYRRGAFTHASQNKIGLFQEAHKGSIFLDEIGDISPTMQTKLLRVLQEKEIKPLGDTKSIRVDSRIIASTNQNLQEKIKKGEFREDFYYRLNVLPIQIPPLRERREDIPQIVNHLLQKHCAKLKQSFKRISPELMEILVNRKWEDNVRQLENVILRGILYSSGEAIHPRDVGLKPAPPFQFCAEETYSPDLPYKEAKELALRRFNDCYIGTLLIQSKGNVTQAARRCGLERQALQQILRRYDLKVDGFRG